MKIEVEDLQALIAKFPELEIVQKITDQYGEENDITKLCEVIAKLAERIDRLS